MAAVGRRHVSYRAPAALLVLAAAATLAGCAGSRKAPAVQSASPPEPQYAIGELTRNEQLVNEGAKLALADGCASCHLQGAKRSPGPNFDSFAGHDVTLADGRRTLVEERFLRQALLHPEETAIAGYEPAPMIRALAPLDLAGHPHDVQALIAFMEQIGPETG